MGRGDSGGDEAERRAGHRYRDAMRHAISTHCALIRPDLPLSRRQHEMISTVVSALNRCFY